MRQRLGIIITVVLAIGVLVAINSLAFVQEEKRQDSELWPNRSTYNSGSTGTRALYDFLNESGYKVMRWREPPEKLLSGSSQVQTFVIIGRPLVAVEDHEAKSLLRWVARGGRLVIIDRRPEEFLLPAAGDWSITTEFLNYPALGDDPANAEQMTRGVKPLGPVQPTTLTRNVNTVQPSRFFSAIKIFTPEKNAAKKKPEDEDTAFETILDEDEDEPPPPAPVGPAATEANSATNTSTSPAPVVHLSTPGAPLLIDYRHGSGRIVLLSDSYMVANDGIALKDNLQLAINLLGGAPGAEGMIAFDEFHQGRMATGNAFATYFAGTPVLAIAGQIVLLVLLILWTRGRRFARPVPLVQVDRRSTLEFVASMAELQQRAHAYDLAIENIYSRTRRVLARYAGVDYNSPRSEIAARVAARSTLNAHQIETLMRQSEEAINGGGINEKQSIHLVKRLREIESALGLRMRSREVKQTAQNI